MIRVSRGAEPRSLQSERRGRLSRAMLDRKAGKASKDLDFTGYEIVKDELAQALNRKCVFCEMALRPEGSPIEHFRPKALVANKGEPRDENRYWWLAWTWENLLFACDRCNNAPYKGNQLPRLGSHQPQPPGLPVFEDPPEFRQLAEELRMRVRALGRYASWEEMKDVFSEVLRLRSWTDAELARLFDRQLATIRSYRRGLTAVNAP